MRILICGGRGYRDRETLFEIMDEYQANCDAPITVLHGAAPGADSLADLWARQRGHAVEKYRAHWETYGTRAGPLRNERMLKMGKPDIVLAFPGGKGTADMVKRAREAQVPVVEVK